MYNFIFKGGYKMAGSHIAIPSILKVGKGTLNNLGKYLKSSDMKNAVIYFGKNHWKKLIPAMVVVMGLFLAFNMYQGEINTVTDTVDKITTNNSVNTTISSGNHLSDITLNDKDFTITYNEEVLTCFGVIRICSRSKPYRLFISI